MDLNGDAEDEAETEEEERDTTGPIFTTLARGFRSGLGQRPPFWNITSNLQLRRKAYPPVPISSPSPTDMVRRKSTGNLGF